MSLCRGIAGRRGKILSVFLFIMGQTVRMLRQRITGITYKTQTWKTDLLTTMCVTMEFCKQRMIQTALGIAAT